MTDVLHNYTDAVDVFTGEISEREPNIHTMKFEAVFPPNANAIKPKVGDGATRLWLDAYLSPVEIAKLVEISNQEVAMSITIEVR